MVNIVIIAPSKYEHWRGLSEISETLKHGFESIGILASQSINTLSPGSTNILLGWHLMNEIQESNLPKNCIIYNLEQLDHLNQALVERLRRLSTNHKIWEYSKKNIEKLTAIGVNMVQHVPIGTMPALSRIKKAPNQDIDVLFYGSINPRRKAILDSLMEEGLSVIAAFGVYGNERDVLISRSKIVLNLHFYESSILEMVRLSYLWANKIAVVAECNSITEIPHGMEKAALFLPYPKLVNGCKALIKNATDRESLGLRAYGLMTSRSETEFLLAIPQIFELGETNAPVDENKNSIFNQTVASNNLSSFPLSKPCSVNSQNENNMIGKSVSMEECLPVLSICIPTYNRAEILRRTLSSIINQPFVLHSAQVEVVVSDNCSTDHTSSVVQEFISSYPEIIRYVRSNQNDEELNFERALRNGKGRFLKLHNDSFGFREGALEPLVKVISKLEITKPVVFIVNEHLLPGMKAVQMCESMDEFMDQVSYRSTWIGGFGIWREHLLQINDFSRYVSKRLTQTDVLLRMISEKRKSVIIRGPMFPCFNTSRKGGYNIAEVFGSNYLSILKEHLAAGNLSEAAYARAKKSVLIEHILPFTFCADHDFKRENLKCHLRDYAEESYFLPALQAASEASDKNNGTQSDRIQRVDKKGTYDDFIEAWRKKNSHNETTPGNLMPIEKISIGRRTYGTINAMFWGHQNEFITIGSFCSIAGGVEFITGGNHPTKGVSTFPFKCKYYGLPHEAISRGPIIIEDDVWIGHRVIILSGVRIGQGAVVGAGAVVTKDVPPYAIVGGNPAIVLRYRFDDNVIAELKKIKYDLVTDDNVNKMKEKMYCEVTIENVKNIVASMMGLNE